MATLTFDHFVTLAGVEARRTTDGRLWRRIGHMWTTHGMGRAELTPAPAVPEPLPASIAPMAVSMAAAVTLGGLGWIIYRRNLLAGTEETSTDWVKAVCEMLSRLFRALATLPRRSRSGRKVLGETCAAPRRQVALDPWVDEVPEAPSDGEPADNVRDQFDEEFPSHEAPP